MGFSSDRLGLIPPFVASSFSASLAGLLWKEILLQKNIKVGRWEFMKNNMGSVFLCMVVGCLVVAAEVCIML